MRRRRPPAPEQAGVIAVRTRRGRPEICLIRRKRSRGWGIPKGQVEAGETHREAALKEAREEAGLSGRLVGRTLGTYQYDKAGATLTVAVYLMEVEAAERRWDEAGIRERAWVSLAAAGSRLKKHPVRPLLDRAMRRTGARES